MSKKTPVSKVQTILFNSINPPNKQTMGGRKAKGDILLSPPAKQKQENNLVTSGEKEPWKRDEVQGQLLDLDNKKEVDRIIQDVVQKENQVWATKAEEQGSMNKSVEQSDEDNDSSNLKDLENSYSSDASNTKELEVTKVVAAPVNQENTSNMVLNPSGESSYTTWLYKGGNHWKYYDSNNQSS